MLLPSGVTITVVVKLFQESHFPRPWPPLEPNHEEENFLFSTGAKCASSEANVYCSLRDLQGLLSRSQYDTHSMVVRILQGLHLFRNNVIIS